MIKIIGLIGGIVFGKLMVIKIIWELGFKVIDVD